MSEFIVQHASKHQQRETRRQVFEAARQQKMDDTMDQINQASDFFERISDWKTTYFRLVKEVNIINQRISPFFNLNHSFNFLLFQCDQVNSQANDMLRLPSLAVANMSAEKGKRGLPKNVKYILDGIDKFAGKLLRAKHEYKSYHLKTLEQQKQTKLNISLIEEAISVQDLEAIDIPRLGFFLDIPEADVDAIASEWDELNLSASFEFLTEE